MVLEVQGLWTTDAAAGKHFLPQKCKAPRELVQGWASKSAGHDIAAARVTAILSLTLCIARAVGRAPRAPHRASPGPQAAGYRRRPGDPLAGVPCGALAGASGSRRNWPTPGLPALRRPPGAKRP